MNYVSAADRRLQLDSAISLTCDGLNFGLTPGTWYYPLKFGNPTTGFIPLSTGVEARLIEAEAALQAGNATAWGWDLNSLRATAPSTYLQLDSAVDSLTTDSTAGASPSRQVDVMFRERAFWLYGTGTRLGDMRRLIRQYGRDQSTVYADGPVSNRSADGLPSPM